MEEIRAVEVVMHLSSRSIHQSHLITADPSAPTPTLLSQSLVLSHKEVGKAMGLDSMRVFEAAYGNSEILPENS